ncbi:IclR family transcriptional regulator [Xanthobacter dioxanivorans]|uniref:IclR family transcriptional regulator n=1 Tax=Xanthobacter dioxanivorans TaxID=2528964 RepID=A0A974PN89_9HYPH|nr:IclR family transcriptional regulator [Xanthobacter dioxanivorans]QRG06702.1 IclR family transcriptional regulator [Xanthobacter dioxanivorans]
MSAVRSASRALQIFEAFGAEGRPLLLTEIAPSIDVPLSSCYGLVQTLLERGYLYAVSRRRGFYPTRKLHTLSTAIVAKDPYLQRLLPHLERLRDAVSETVIVGTRQNDQVLYLEVLEGPQTIRYSASPGDFKPLHSSSIGKALLSLAPDDGVDTLAAKALLPAITPNTITDRDRLKADLKAGRARGYFMTRGENMVDVTALAAPMELEGMTVGVAIAGPSYRMEQSMETLADRLLDTVGTIKAVAS